MTVLSSIQAWGSGYATAAWICSVSLAPRLHAKYISPVRYHSWQPVSTSMWSTKASTLPFSILLPLLHRFHLTLLFINNPPRSQSDP
jgi:hypothetical protein